MMQYTLEILSIGENEVDRLSFLSATKDWSVQFSGRSSIFVPKNQLSSECTIDEFIVRNIDQHRTDISRISSISDRSEIRVAVFYDPTSVAVICLSLTAETLAKMREMDMDYEICLFPSAN